MKKYTQLMLVAALAAFASCNGNNGGDAAAQKAHDDSVINARNAEMEANMKRNNDSLINAKAQERADSIMNASKNASKPSAVSARPVEHTNTKVHQPAPPPTIGNGKPAMGDNKNTTNKNNSNTIGNGKPKMGDK